MKQLFLLFIVTFILWTPKILKERTSECILIKQPQEGNYFVYENDKMVYAIDIKLAN